MQDNNVAERIDDIEFHIGSMDPASEHWRDIVAAILRLKDAAETQAPNALRDGKRRRRDAKARALLIRMIQETPTR